MDIEVTKRTDKERVKKSEELYIKSLEPGNNDSFTLGVAMGYIEVLEKEVRRLDRDLEELRQIAVENWGDGTDDE